jgi:hypothetical protein
MRYLKWFLPAAFLASINPAHAQFSGIVFFGDSNTDSGRYLYLPEVRVTLPRSQPLAVLRRTRVRCGRLRSAPFSAFR